MSRNLPVISTDDIRGRDHNEKQNQYYAICYFEKEWHIAFFCVILYLDKKRSVAMVPQVFGKEHIIYMILSTLVGAAGLLLAKRYAKTEKAKTIVLKSIEATLKAEEIPVPCEINVLVTNDQGIRAINAASREIDSATDVLSFPMFELVPGNPPEDWENYLDPETELCPLGDMCISLQLAEAQAKEFGYSSRREVGYLTIHSMLHLLGYDHLDEGPQKKQMRAREETIAATIPGMSR